MHHRLYVLDGRLIFAAWLRVDDLIGVEEDVYKVVK